MDKSKTEVLLFEAVLQRVKNKKEAMILLELDMKLEMLGVLVENYERQHRVLRSISEAQDTWKSLSSSGDYKLNTAVPLIRQLDEDQQDAVKLLRSKVDKLTQAIRELCFSLTTYADINSQVARELSGIDGCNDVGRDKEAIASMELEVVARAHTVCRQAVERFSSVSNDQPTVSPPAISSTATSNSLAPIDRELRCSFSMLRKLHGAPVGEHVQRHVSTAPCTSLDNVGATLPSLPEIPSVAPVTTATSLVAGRSRLCDLPVVCSIVVPGSDCGPPCTAQSSAVVSHTLSNAAPPLDTRAGAGMVSTMNGISCSNPSGNHLGVHRQKTGTIQHSRPSTGFPRTTSGSLLYPPSFPASVPGISHHTTYPAPQTVTPVTVASTSTNLCGTVNVHHRSLAPSSTGTPALASHATAACLAAGGSFLMPSTNTATLATNMVQNQVLPFPQQPVHRPVSLVSHAQVSAPIGVRHVHVAPLGAATYAAQSSVVPGRHYVVHSGPQLNLRRTTDPLLVAGTPPGFAKLAVSSLAADQLQQGYQASARQIITPAGLTSVSLGHGVQPAGQFTHCLQVPVQHTALRLPSHGVHALSTGFAPNRVPLVPISQQPSTDALPLHGSGVFDAVPKASSSLVVNQSVALQRAQLQSTEEFAVGPSRDGSASLGVSAGHTELTRQTLPQGLPVSCVLRGDAAPSSSTDGSGTQGATSSGLDKPLQPQSFPSEAHALSSHADGLVDTSRCPTGAESPVLQQQSFAFQPVERVANEDAATPVLKATGHQQHAGSGNDAGCPAEQLINSATATPSTQSAGIQNNPAALLMDSQRDSTSPNKAAAGKKKQPERNRPIVAGVLDHGSGCKARCPSQIQSLGDAPTPTSKRSTLPDLVPDASQHLTTTSTGTGLPFINHAPGLTCDRGNLGMAQNDADNLQQRKQGATQNGLNPLSHDRPNASACAQEPVLAALGASGDHMLGTQLPSVDHRHDAVIPSPQVATLDAKIVSRKRGRDEDGDMLMTQKRQSPWMDSTPVEENSTLGQLDELFDKSGDSPIGATGQLCWGQNHVEHPTGATDHHASPNLDLLPLDLKMHTSEEEAALMCTQPETAVC